MQTAENFIENLSYYKEFANVSVNSWVATQDKKYPLVSIKYGNPTSPTLLVVGGVHGLERIGAQLSLSLLNNFHQRLTWDSTRKDLLKKIQVVFIPLANPYGYFQTTRSNQNGVDLMRNAPIEATEKVPTLLGGHRYSNKLPWYRGHEVEQETQFLLDTVKDILTQTDQLISVDIHSGFGFNDQLWFPFAGSKKEFTQINELYLLFELFKKAHPYHIYKIEPQSKNYMTHGDIWDYSYLNLKKEHQLFLPLTLEMGSWIWVKKNPIQIFSKIGLFNPIKEHRLNRTLRRHYSFFDFLLYSLASHHVWSKPDLSNSLNLNTEAINKYYGRS